MKQFPLHGKLVRLTVVDPEVDAGIFEAWGRDFEFQRFLNSCPPRPWIRFFQREKLDKALEETLTFIIVRIEDERKIGFVELDGIDWVTRNTWVGIGIAGDENWGKGYGTDAMRVVINYAFTVLNLRRVTLNVFGYNERAIKSYLKLGFKVEGVYPEYLERDGERWDVVFMGLMRSEWNGENRDEQTD